MPAFQSFEQFFAAQAQIAQAMLRHEEKALQRSPPLVLAADDAQPSGKSSDDVSKRGPDGTIGSNINEKHLVFSSGV